MTVLGTFDSWASDDQYRMCTKFVVDTSRHFPFTVRTNRQTRLDALLSAALSRYLAWIWLSLAWQRDVIKWFGDERMWTSDDLRRLFTLLVSVNCDVVCN